MRTLLSAIECRQILANLRLRRDRARALARRRAWRRRLSPAHSLRDAGGAKRGRVVREPARWLDRSPGRRRGNRQPRSDSGRETATAPDRARWLHTAAFISRKAASGVAVALIGDRPSDQRLGAVRHARRRTPARAAHRIDRDPAPSRTARRSGSTAPMRAWRPRSAPSRTMAMACGSLPRSFRITPSLL